MTRVNILRTRGNGGDVLQRARLSMRGRGVRGYVRLAQELDELREELPRGYAKMCA